jgi:hypothetical protein
LEERLESDVFVVICLWLLLQVLESFSSGWVWTDFLDQVTFLNYCYVYIAAGETLGGYARGDDATWRAAQEDETVGSVLNAQITHLIFSQSNSGRLTQICSPS